MTTGWQPISTAPIGVPVLCWSPNQTDIFVGRRLSSNVVSVGRGYETTAEKWMPLPEPPA